MNYSYNSTITPVSLAGNDGVGSPRAINVAGDTATQALIEDLEHQYVSLKCDRDSLQLEVEDARMKISEMTQKVSHQHGLEIQLQNLRNEFALSSSNLEALTEKRNRDVEQLDRQSLESDSLREELNRMTKANDELQKKVLEIDLQSKLTASDAIPLSHEKQRLESEVASLRSHSNFLEQELVAKSKQFQHLQRESRDRTIQLQLQLDQTISEKEAQTARSSVLEKIERRLQDKLNQLTHDSLNAKLELENSRQNFEIESRDEKRIVDLQKEQLHLWRQRFDEVTKENEDMKRSAAEAIILGEKELESATKNLEEKFVGLLKDQAAQYEKTIAGFSSAQASITLYDSYPIVGYEEDVNEEESECYDGPLRVTELFQRLQEAKSELRKEKVERKVWQLRHERIEKEVISTAPKIIRQREEYDMAIEQLSDYQRRLESALCERDDAVRCTDETRRAVEALQARLEEQKAESRDLAKQVQALLLGQISGDDTSGADIPTSISQMQSQNQRLLAENRNLLQQAADLQKQVDSDVSKKELEKYNAEYEMRRDEMLRQEELVERIVQQRDLYRALLAKNDCKIIGIQGEEATALDIAREYSDRAKTLQNLNSELELSIKVLMSERDAAIGEREETLLRLEKHKANATELSKSIEICEKEMLVLNGREARSSSEAMYHKNRCEQLEGSLDRARSEIANLNNARNELQRINDDLQDAISKTHEERGIVDSEKLCLESKLRLAQAQLETCKHSDSRLSEENRQLRSEVATHGSVSDSLRRIEAGILSKHDSEKTDLCEESIEQTKLVEEQILGFKVEKEKLLARLQDLEDVIKDLHMATAASDKDRASMRSQIEELRAKKNFLRSSANDSNHAVNKDGVQHVDDTAVNSIAARLELQLATVKDENTALRKSVDAYQKIAKESELSVDDVKRLAEQDCNEKAQEVIYLKQEIDRMKKLLESRDEVIRELARDLSSEQELRERLANELKENVISLQTEKNKADDARAKAASGSQEMDALRIEVISAQRNFERELSLHSQARTELRKVQEQADERLLELKSAYTKIEILQQEMEGQKKLWEDEATSAKQTVELLEKRCVASSSQNRILHDQLESMARALNANNANAVNLNISNEVVDSTNVAEHQGGTSELQELVKFLHNENELAQIQIDTANRSVDREKAVSVIIRRDLEEATAQLQILRSVKSVLNTPTTSKTADVKINVSEEQLRLLKDSNKLLRNEIEKIGLQMSTAQQELDDARKSLEPEKATQNELQFRVAALEAEKTSLSKDLASWKDRVNTLVSTFNQIDPEDYKRLQIQIADLAKENESLNSWKKATEEESNRIRGIAKTLNQKNREQKACLDLKQKELDQLNAEKSKWSMASSATSSIAKDLAMFKERMEKAVAFGESKQRELEDANHRNDRLREKLREFQTLIKELRTKEKLLSQQSLSSTPFIETGISNTLHSTTASEPTKEYDSKETDQNAQSLLQPDTILSIPDGGFKFGPSDNSRVLPSKPEGNKLESSFRTLPSASSRITETAKVNDSDTSLSKHPQTSEPSGSVPLLRSSSYTKEQSMKEILLAKKMKLAEALKRKQQNESNASSLKRTKIDVVVDDAAKEKDSTPLVTVSASPALLETVVSLNTSLQLDGAASTAAADECSATFGLATRGDDEKMNVVEADTFAGNEKTSIAKAATSSSSLGMIFGQPFSVDKNPISATSTGSTTTSNIGFGGAFLDMKPPGSSAQAPTFMFGKSSSIVLQPPSLPVPPNPFGAFSSSTSFSSFGAASGTTMPSMPLFGNATAHASQGGKDNDIREEKGEA